MRTTAATVDLWATRRTGWCVLKYLICVHGMLWLTMASPEVAGGASVLRKCCPDGHVLGVQRVEVPHRYECLNVSGDAPETAMITLSGYMVESPVDGAEIPRCAVLTLFEIAANYAGEIVAGETCVDRIDGRLVGLKCADSLSSERLIAVQTVSKCCEHGALYDLTERQCVVQSQSDRNTYATLGAASATPGAVLLADVRPPVCDDDAEVFVEYLSGRHRMRLHAGSLDVWSVQHGESEHLSAGTYCVEATVMTMSPSPSQPDGDATTTTTSSAEFSDDEETTTNMQPTTEVALDDNRQPELIVRTCRPRAICDRIACVRRCCRNEQMMERRNGTTECVRHERNIRPTFYAVQLPLDATRPPAIADVAEYGLIHMQTCNRYILDASYPEDVHYINEDGRLHVVALEDAYGPDKYCVEYVNQSGLIEFQTFVCFQGYKQPKFLYYPVGLMISSVFLWLTLIVYISLPKLLNLHGKTLVCHVCSLLIAYTALAIAQFHMERQMASCYVVGYIIYFGFVSSFCWQSIMCFDIWWTFGSMRMSRGMQKHKELRRFLLYSLYAWGVAILLTSVTILFDYHQWLPYEWSPNIIQENHCWFQNDDDVRFAQLVFFLLPIGLHIVTNSVLFALTAHHCSKVKGEIHRMQTQADEQDTQRAKKKFLADRTKYVMNMKLFVVMGVSWVLEVLATLYRQNSIVWYFSDAVNILQGVLVFLIFVFKWKVWHAIQHRLGFRNTATRGTTNATATTQLSNGVNGRVNGVAAVKPYGRLVSKSVSTSTLATSNVNLAAIRRD